MEYPVYTLASWRVKPGLESKFVDAWTDLGSVFAALPNPPVLKGTLLQSVSDPLQFYSFGPWKSLDDALAMRSTPAAQEAISRVAAFCDEAKPGAFRVVKEIGLEP